MDCFVCQLHEAFIQSAKIHTHTPWPSLAFNVLIKRDAYIISEVGMNVKAVIFNEVFSLFATNFSFVKESAFTSVTSF